MFNITHTKKQNLEGKIVITFAHDERQLSPAAKELDSQIQGGFTSALGQSRFTGGEGQIRFIDTYGRGGPEGVLLVGVGKLDKLKEDSFRRMGIAAGKTLREIGVSEAVLMSEGLGEFPEETATLAFVEGLALGSYQFQDYRTNLKDDEKTKFEALTVVSTIDALKPALEGLKGLMEGSEIARALVNHPANVANPLYIVEQTKAMKKLGLSVEVLGPKELKKLGCNLLLSVGEGSTDGSYMVVMKWQGAGKDYPFKALVGKGVTFDTGGYNIKVQMMDKMKSDMAGAAAVIGAMTAIAKRKSKVNVIAVVGLVENMVSARATRPSDVIKSYKGLTVEVNNTDAEGRLVLADCMAYIIDKEKPSEVIDIATLTGAISIALGNRFAGLFSNNDNLARRLIEAGEDVGEAVWRMPTDSGYHKLLKSETADLSNIGGPTAGSCTAAAFLEEFVGNTPWAHLDIAGVAMAGKVFGAANSNNIDGANGFGARLFVRYLENSQVV